MKGKADSAYSFHRKRGPLSIRAMRASPLQTIRAMRASPLQKRFLAFVLCIVLALCVLAGCGEEQAEAGWRDAPLLDGIPVFAGGNELSASVTDDVLRVFFENVTPDAVAGYRSDSGLAFTEKSPFVAEYAGRLVILTYDGESKLSFVVVKN